MMRRLLLLSTYTQVAWRALEHAGYAPRSGTPSRTAVFASSGIDGSPGIG